MTQVKNNPNRRMDISACNRISLLLRLVVTQNFCLTTMYGIQANSIEKTISAATETKQIKMQSVKRNNSMTHIKIFMN